MTTGAPDPVNVREALAHLPFEAILHFGVEASSYQTITNFVARACRIAHPNPIHRKLATLLSEGLAAVVTPNYDNGIEQSDEAIKVISDVSDWVASNSQNQPCVFKIHGSLIGQTESHDAAGEKALIFDLPREASLSDWRYECLAHLVEDRTVLFVAYSGVDFDILPALAQMNIDEVIWNSLSSPTQGWSVPPLVALFLSSHTAYVVPGDLWGVCLAELGPDTSDPKKPLDRSSCPDAAEVLDPVVARMPSTDWVRWCALALPAVGHGRAALRMLESLEPNQFEDPANYYRALGRACFHIGRYKDAAAAHLEGARLTDALSEDTNSAVASRMLDAVEAFRQEGAFLRSLFLLGRCFIRLKSLAHEGTIHPEVWAHFYHNSARHPLLWPVRHALQLREKEFADMSTDLFTTAAAWVGDIPSEDRLELQELYVRLGHVIGESNGLRYDGERLIKMSSQRARHRGILLLEAQTLLEHSIQKSSTAGDAAGVMKAAVKVASITPNKSDARKFWSQARSALNELQLRPLTWAWHRVRIAESKMARLRNIRGRKEDL